MMIMMMMSVSDQHAGEDADKDNIHPDNDDVDEFGPINRLLWIL